MQMKHLILFLIAQTLSVCCLAQEYQEVRIDNAPFDMPVIHEFVYPEKNFPITKYGAKADGKTDCTKAFRKAMAACAKAGGGHVVVPKGEWFTGPIHFQSNVDLHLEDGAVVRFSDNPADYLPAVFTTWEGVECYNYSPLVYAYECKNIKISGTGTLKPKMDTWKAWYARPQAHLDATERLYTWCSTLTPLTERYLTDLKESNMRPHLIQFNRCQNVVLENFHIRQSPFWTIHLYMCNEGIVRGLDVYAHGHNNDGIDIDMTSNVLVENCQFDQGDDAVVIKAGRNQDAWRINRPSENIVVRNCTIHDGHVLLGIGSEMSGGVRNVWLHDCQVNKRVMQGCYIKTNERRGGFVKNIFFENIHLKAATSVLAIHTDVLYQWKKFPTYETRYTDIEGIHVNNVTCDSAAIGIDIKGDSHLPARDISVDKVTITKVSGSFIQINNVKGVTLDKVSLK